MQIGIQYADTAAIEVAVIDFHQISGKGTESTAERLQVSLEDADIA